MSVSVSPSVLPVTGDGPSQRALMTSAGLVIMLQTSDNGGGNK